MADPNFDSAFVNFGTGLTGSVSGTPVSGPPLVAFVSSLNKVSGHGAAPDVSWTASPGGSEFLKILNAGGLLNVSQTFGVSSTWVEMLLFFGSNGTLPVLTQIASASTSNPGTGASRTTAPMIAVPAGRDLLLFMYLNATNGFFLTPETYTLSDSVGNTYTFLAEVHNLDGAGNGSQLIVFHCPNALAGPLNWTMAMKQTVGDGAASVALTYFFYAATNMAAVKSGLRLLLSLGVGQ